MKAKISILLMDYCDMQKKKKKKKKKKTLAENVAATAKWVGEWEREGGGK